ncbi:MAG: hypothetical protein IH880_04465, partial [Candidatus Marinimicrobia bacterium]|nr:hypothetical protein [Candidatus Neomarinimicrobiota bacterium]
MSGNSALLHARGIYSSFAGSGSEKISSTNRISSDEDVRVITAAGTGMVIEKRYDIAKKNAVYDALNNAIESILGLMSAPELISRNYQLLENNIFSNPLEYIKKYEIIQTEMIKEDIYSVKIEAIIDTDKLE